MLIYFQLDLPPYVCFIAQVCGTDTGRSGFNEIKSVGIGFVCDKTHTETRDHGKATGKSKI